MDVYNLTNANTVYDVRTGSGPDEHPGRRRSGGSPPPRFRRFISPTGVLGPRIIRFNVTYQFGQR